MTKTHIAIPGPWEFREFPQSARRMSDLNEGRWLPASQPSSVILSLADAAMVHLPDVYATPEAFGWIGRQDWVFRTHFDVSEFHCQRQQIELVLEGLDTITHIWVNEKLVGKTESMYVAHRFDVKPWIRPGRNTLVIKFASACEHAEMLIKRYGAIPENTFGDPRRVYLRKAQYQFGTAMGPALPDCGITGPVRIDCFSLADIDDIHIRTIDCNSDYADMRIAVSIRDLRPDLREPVRCVLTLRHEDAEQVHTLLFETQQNPLAAVIRIENPSLWQPRGYGDASLYALTAELFDRSTLLDRKELTFGIRSLRVIGGHQRETMDFGIEVNGQPVYLKGATWLPTALFSTSANADRKRRLLQSLADAHINILRIWGGGIYEDDLFYRECDRLGILVWQDFMFASAYYPDESWFTEQIQREAQSVIRRLRNYACLAVWCGNSHIDRLHAAGQLGKGKKFYGKAIFHTLLPQLLAELDPNRDYFPTTPENATDNKDCVFTDLWHLWNHALPAETLSAEAIPPFVIEAGFQSLPQTETLAMACSSDSTAISSAAVEKQNYHAAGPQRIAHFAAEYFAPPKTLAEQIDQSQIVQARAMKKIAEMLRANNSVNRGLLLWSANDFWPGAGFSMIDYRNTPKALYYYARRFFAPVLICLTSVRRDALSAPQQSIVIVNDSAQMLTGQVILEQLDMKGRRVDSSSYPITVSPFSRSRPAAPAREFLSPICPEKSILRLAVVQDDCVLSENIYLYQPDKYMEYRPLDIDIEITQRDERTLVYALQSRYFVKDVQLILNQPAVVSDNFFDMLPNCSYEIKAEFAAPPAKNTPLILRSANGG